MSTQNKKLPLRPPHTIAQNLQYIRWKINRLTRFAKPSSTNQNQLFQEIQQALKMFEVGLILGE